MSTSLKGRFMENQCVLVFWCFPGRVINVSMAVLRALVMGNIPHGTWDIRHRLICSQFILTVYGHRNELCERGCKPFIRCKNAAGSRRVKCYGCGDYPGIDK